MPQKSFEEQLRDKAEGFSPEPRPGLWEAVEAGLVPERKKKRAAFLLPVAIVGVLAGLGWALSYTITEQDKSLPVVKVDHTTRHHHDPKPAKDQPAAVNVAPDQAGQAERAGKPIQIHTPETESQKQLAHNTGSSPKRSPAKKDAYAGILVNPSHGSDLDKPFRLQPENAGSEKTEMMSLPVIEDSEEKQRDVLKPESIQAEAPVAPALPEIMKDESEDIKKPADTVKKTPDVEVDPVIKRKTYFAEVLLSRVVSGSRLTIEKHYKDSMPYKEQLDERRMSDKKVWNYGFGIQAGVSKKRFDFTIGLQYHVLAYQVYVRNINSSILRGSITTFANFDFNATDSFSVASSRTKSSGGQFIKNSFTYISLPLGVTYKLPLRSKFSVGIAASLAPQFLMHYKGLLYQESSGFYVKEQSAAENNIRRFNLALNAGLDLGYHFGTKGYLAFRPQYGISLMPAEKAAISTSHQFWSLSLACRRYF